MKDMEKEEELEDEREEVEAIKKKWKYIEEIGEMYIGLVATKM